MQKLILALGIACFQLLHSCGNSINTKIATENIVEAGIVGESEAVPFATHYDIKADSCFDGKGLGPLGWQEFGPYSVTGESTKILTSEKLSLSGIPGLAPGVYSCDVFESKVEITLPADAVLNFHGQSKTGYADYSTRVPGVGYTQTLLSEGSKRYTFSTFSVLPLRNESGQEISARAFPTELTNVTFSYSYLQNL